MFLRRWPIYLLEVVERNMRCTVSKIEKPKNFVPAKDRKNAKITLMIALVCSLVLFDPFSIGPNSFNVMILQAIPLRVALLMFVVPFAIYLSILATEKVYYYEFVEREKRRGELKKKARKLIFTSRYRPREEKTIFDITNRSAFSWTNARIFVERRCDNEKLTEKHEMGDVEPLKRITLQTNLNCIPGSRWRVMVLTEEGYLIDFPERQSSLVFEEVQFGI
jgi:hypothetical protein